jgi:tight adherence protein B
MSVAGRLGLVALAAAALAGAASGAGPRQQSLRIVEAGGTTYPEKAYILTLPEKKSLNDSDVTVKENGATVPGVNVTRQGATGSGYAVVLLVDESLTMKGEPIAKAYEAARAFAQDAPPDLKVAVVTFNGKVDVAQNFGTGSDAVNGALSKEPNVAYGTKVYDALAQAAELAPTANAKSVSAILLTDGENLGSVTSLPDALHALNQGHVRVFTVGLKSPAFDPTALKHIAAATGGDYVQASSPAELKGLFEALGQRLASEYLVTYKTRQNPSTHVVVAFSVKGYPKPARTAYKTPALHIVPAPPYRAPVTGRIIQSRYLLYGVALVCALLVGLAIIIASSRKPEPLVDRVGSFVSVPEQSAAEPEPARPMGPNLVGRISARASKADWWDRLAETLELAEIKASPLQFVLFTAVLTILAVLILGLIFGFVGILIGASAPFLVRMFVKRRVSNKRRAFAEQLPDNLEVLASALRAGHSLVGSLNVMTEDSSEPSKTEFRRVLTDEQLGVPLEDALKVCIKRMDNKDLDQVALVAKLQRDMGSNSAEVLDKVVEAVRTRMELRRLIRSLTAQGRASRWVLTLLPVGLAVVLTILSTTYMHPLFYTTLGRVLLVISAIMVAMGSWVIGKIIDIHIV